MIHKKVLFKDTIYWYHDEQGIFPPMLSPLDHYDKQGDLEVNPLSAHSYAIIEGDNIMRFGSIIGNISDLVDLLS